MNKNDDNPATATAAAGVLAWDPAAVAAAAAVAAVVVVTDAADSLLQPLNYANELCSSRSLSFLS